VYDLDGNEYIDLCMSFGANLLGHAHPKVVEAVNRALDMGIMCGYENDWHTRLAERIVGWRVHIPDAPWWSSLRAISTVLTII
jgi:glutamate-1-semialdehyde 2,1-aminomutase